MNNQIPARRSRFPFLPPLARNCARFCLALTAALLLVSTYSGCVAPAGTSSGGGYTYSCTRPTYGKGKGATGTLTCTFAPTSPKKPTTMTFTAGGRSARVPGTIRGLARTNQSVRFHNAADGADFPSPPEKIALKPSPYERDAKIFVTVKKAP